MYRFWSLISGDKVISKTSMKSIENAKHIAHVEQVFLFGSGF